MVSNAAPTRMGTITGYDPNNYAVKVLRQPEGVETGWLPITTVWGGDGWGLFAGPNIGAQVKLEHQEDGTETAICDGVVYNDQHKPRVEGLGGVPSGEFWLVHKSGTRIRLRNDSALEMRHRGGSLLALHENGTIEIAQAGGSYAKLLPDGTIDLRGSSILAAAEGASPLPVVHQLFMELFNGHTHGTGPPPAQQMTASHLTTAFRAR